MSIADIPTGLDAFFSPRGIAVIGASDGRVKAGGRTLATILDFGYRGHVYPVSPRGGELHGVPVVASIAEIDGPVDLAIVCLRAELVPGALRECAAKGITAAVVYAAGFSDPELAAELAAAQAETGIRVIGPNTVGIRRLDEDGTGVFGTFSGDVEHGLTPGPVAMVAQSGGLGVYFGSAYLQELGVGARYLIDTGAELDVDAAEMIEHLAGDDAVRVIAVILEGSRDGRRLQAAVRRATAAGKAVVFMKAGRSAAAAEQVASHTGAMVGSSALFDIAMAEAGAIVVGDEGELVDVVRLCSTGHRPSGRRVGIVTPSGGFGILAIDAAERFGVELPALGGETTPDLAEDLAMAHLGNPLDYMANGGQRPGTLAAALTWMGGQTEVDAVILWQAYVLMREDQRQHVASALRAADLSGTPLFGCGITTPEFEEELLTLGMQWWTEPTRLIRAIAAAAPAGETAPVPAVVHTESAQAVVTGAEARTLTPDLGHADVVEVTDRDAAHAAAADWGRVVLKVEDPRFPHKTELGLVSGLVDAGSAAEAFDRIAAARSAAGITETPVIAQRAEKGVELAFGGYLDPVFGASVMVAMGGIHLEIDKDLALAVAPIDAAKAKSLILSLRGAPRLQGARGTAPADVDAAAAALARFSEFFAASEGRWASADVNPVMVKPAGDGIAAVDIVLVPATGAAEKKEGQAHG